jgi:hypothetical protein
VSTPGDAGANRHPVTLQATLEVSVVIEHDLQDHHGLHCQLNAFSVSCAHAFYGAG